MITVKTDSEATDFDYKIKVEVTGHAQPIVCAGVSTLVGTLEHEMRVLEDKRWVKHVYSEGESGNAVLEASACKDAFARATLMIMTHYFLNGIELIAEKYPDEVKTYKTSSKVRSSEG